MGQIQNLSVKSFLLAAHASRFFIQLPFLNTVSQATHGTLLPTAQHLCDLWDAMPRHWSPSTSNPTLT